MVCLRILRWQFSTITTIATHPFTKKIDCRTCLLADRAAAELAEFQDWQQGDGDDTDPDAPAVTKDSPSISGGDEVCDHADLRICE